MESSLAMIFSFKFISFGYSIIMLNVDDICLYYVSALSKKLMISDENILIMDVSIDLFILKKN